MFGMLRRLSRPFVSIGRKVGKLFGLGKKVVQQERVIERGGRLAEVGNDFVKVPVFESNFRGDKFFTGADELNRNTKAFTNRGAGFGLNENVRVPNYNPDHMDYATKYRDIWGQSIIRD
tara:strand:+ start:274 stop:630 length:357 start_codon:yes stop_codon:yes gene_type:complete